MVGFGLGAAAEPLEGFGDEVLAKYSPAEAKLLIVGGNAGEHGGVAMEALLSRGFSDVVEIKGGYGAWSKVFRTNGQRRVYGKWGDPTSSEHDYWTASN
mmetsp:Transcript_40037/g.113454  ORF Transcript_40037/g.113454 Transcript_40037/m.113454 type:complete len:99 (+) Transcript_40037:3-299(+)